MKNNLPRKRRILIVDEYSVFHNLVKRAIIRVCHNDITDLEIMRAQTERQALRLIKTQVTPDVIISRKPLASPLLNGRFTIVADDPFDQDKLKDQILELLLTKTLRRQIA